MIEYISTLPLFIQIAVGIGFAALVWTLVCVGAAVIYAIIILVIKD